MTRSELAYLADLAKMLDDVERVRIMNSNRIAAHEREFGSSPPHLQVLQERLAAVEHETVLELQRAWRRHPLAAWAKLYVGVGEKSIARLLGTIGDPADRPNVAKLWQYCGHGNPHLKRFKGMTQEQAFMLGNPAAKKTVYLIATCMLKAGNRDVYDARRAATMDRDWTDGHKHADALRVTGKAFLRDLWVAARAGHSTPGALDDHARAGQSGSEDRSMSARAGQGRLDAHSASARAGAEAPA